jgi:FkbM family methyltransferase
MIRFLQAHLRPGQCAFDVGANLGDYTRVMMKLVGPAGTVCAFEPNAEIADRLAARLDAPHVQIHRCALSDAVEVRRPFFLDAREGMQGFASSLERLDGTANATRLIEVETMTIDRFCAERGLTPDLVKIDVEGHELEVLRGAVETIQSRRPVIVFEFWETWWERSVSRIFDLLRPQYRLVRIQDGENADEYYRSHRGTGIVDIGCIPPDRSVAGRWLPRFLRLTGRSTSLPARCPN